MKVVADAIREGAEGFLSTQYGTIGRWSLVVAGGLFLIYLIRPVGESAHVSSFSLAVLTVLGFLLGAACSGLAGWVGVWISVRCNLRVAGAAANKQAGQALKLAFCGGAVSSIISAAMCILGISLLYSLLYASFVLGGGLKVHAIPLLLVGYGFGASFVALFMQLGGGIYTKAADVGADMCGKVRARGERRQEVQVEDLL
eukprot:752237-Hanusia_phi.AAC.1